MLTSILQRIVEEWGIPDPEFPGYVANHVVTASEVWRVLERENGAEAVSSELKRYLVSQGEREGMQGEAAPEDIFLINACFELCGAVDELKLDAATTRVLVRSLPPIGYHRLLRQWVRLHFDQAQLLHLLAEGIRDATTDFKRACSVHGLRMYLKELREARPHFCAGLGDFESAMRPIVNNDDELLRETTDDALKLIWKLRESHPDCPKTTAHELRAYRHEEGPSIYYTVERLADGHVALRVPTCEIDQDTLTIEYWNQEPSLLPDDVPDVLNDTLIGAHLSDGQKQKLSQVRYSDLLRKTSIMRTVNVLAV